MSWAYPICRPGPLKPWLLPGIPVWNMQNGWLGISYYQRFVEGPIHLK